MKEIIHNLEEQIRRIRNVKNVGNLSGKVTLSHVDAETLVKFYYDSQRNFEFWQNVDKLKEIMKGM